MNKPASCCSMLASLLLMTACVTVNVYFPAAAAESAADRFIRDVYGDTVPRGAEPGSDRTQPEKLPQEMPHENMEKPQSGIKDIKDTNEKHLLAVLSDLIIAPAWAQQPDINISTPGINKLKNAMSARHEQLKPFYSSGAVGMDRNGFITVRDESAVALKDRNTVKKLVSNENSDRAALYREIASANGHPEWEPDIQAIFASRWVANAPPGWWYKDSSGNWVKK